MSPDGLRVVVLRVGYTGAQFRESRLIHVPIADGTGGFFSRPLGLSAPGWIRDGTAVVADQISGAELVEVASLTRRSRGPDGPPTPKATLTGQAWPATSASLAVGRAQYCWPVRAHDAAGNVGAWSGERCA